MELANSIFYFTTISTAIWYII